jgi:hypothetical protein
LGKKIVINWITGFQISLSTTNQISELTAQKKKKRTNPMNQKKRGFNNKKKRRKKFPLLYHSSNPLKESVEQRWIEMSVTSTVGKEKKERKWKKSGQGSAAHGWGEWRSG